MKDLTEDEIADLVERIKKAPPFGCIPVSKREMRHLIKHPYFGKEHQIDETTRRRPHPRMA